MYVLLFVKHVVLTYHLPILLTDVITIEKTSENFRLVYDVKGRFAIHRITPDEAAVSFAFLSATFESSLWSV